MSPEERLTLQTLGWKVVRKKPVAVQAVEITPNNYYDLVLLVNANGGDAYHYHPERAAVREHNDAFWLKTLQGVMSAQYGDYLIYGTEGEFYPVKPHVYPNVYEDVVMSEKD